MMNQKFVNGRFLLGEEYSEAVSAEHFKKSGDLVINEYPDVGLYLYRHFIELQLKSLMKRFDIQFNHNHDIEKLLENLNDVLSKDKILTNEEIVFISQLILNYAELDKKGTTLRYPNSKNGENLILSDKFIKKYEINNLDNPYLYKINSDEVKADIDKLFEILFKIHSILEENKYYEEYYEKEPF